MGFFAGRSLRALRSGLAAALLAAAALWRCGQSPETPTPPQPTPTPTPLGPPNVVVIVADDMGYADLSCYGAPLIKTPNLDRLASEGLRFTQFTVPAPLCTPSRGSLLTGLYPPQTGLTRQLGPGNTTGMDADEVTLAVALKARGYATGMVGKWGLGDLPQFLPTHRGFDSYFGIPSNSDLGLLTRNDGPAPDAVSEDLLNRRYTEEAAGFIRSAKAQPFFLYLAYQSPHVPLWVSSAFRGKSAGGLYGDVVEELDWGVGEVVKALRDNGVDRNTLVFFLSDNGPWLARGVEGGSAGALRDGKGTPFEGGVREPFIVWCPARVRGGRVVTEPVGSLDVFPTVVTMAGGALPTGRVYHGLSLAGLLAGEATRLPGNGIDGGREFLTYSGGAAVALRSGRYKIVRPGFWSTTPGLFDLEADPGEEFDLIRSRPELAAQLSDRLDALAGDVARGAPPPK
jgi:arylsulfatase A-like enzyme